MTQVTKRIPPYLPFKTFLSSIEALAQDVPPKIDRTLWRNQSGINQGLIMAAYRFLGLVKDGDTATTELASMAGNPPVNGPKVIKEIINFQYSAIVKHDLTKMTMKMLDDAFEEQFQVSGATKQKAITFFLKAAKFADLSLSPYLLTQLRNAAKKPRRSRQQIEEDDSGSKLPHNGQPAPASSHSVQLVSGGRLTISISANPFTMPSEDRNFFFSVVDMLQKYGQDHPDVQQEKE
ncbi:MAG: hypothetical protein LAN71_12340 [Acidobacteriia bacterium]|nr:hypothetical protein [Terriglobia bacterium]